MTENVEAAGHPKPTLGEFNDYRLVEAAGIEPYLAAKLNLLMACDFGFYDMKTIELRRRYLSPRVPSSLGDILETANTERVWLRLVPYGDTLRSIGPVFVESAPR